MAGENDAVRKALIDWYRVHHRRLPWRETRDPYRIWVSEVMAQQTQVATVVGYYRRFVERFPTVEALARADLATVLKLWEGLGYYRRARHLHKAASLMVSVHGGRFPDRYDAVRALPGVGDYIASAVTSIAYDQPHAVVDGNVKRVLARFFEIDTPVNAPAAHRIFKAVATGLLDTGSPGIFNQALMELGARVCKPRHPLCGECPLSGFCKAGRNGTTDAFPARLSRAKTPEYAIAVAAVMKKGRVLVVQRPAEGLLGGLWEFPGGKIRPGESAADACCRKLRETVGLAVASPEELLSTRHAYSHFRIRMTVFTCRYTAGRVVRNGPAAHRWAAPATLARLAFHQANRKFIDAVVRAMDRYR